MRQHYRYQRAGAFNLIETEKKVIQLTQLTSCLDLPLNGQCFRRCDVGNVLWRQECILVLRVFFRFAQQYIREILPIDVILFDESTKSVTRVLNTKKTFLLSIYREDIVLVEKEEWMVDTFPQGHQKADGDV